MLIIINSSYNNCNRNLFSTLALDDRKDIQGEKNPALTTEAKGCYNYKNHPNLLGCPGTTFMQIQLLDVPLPQGHHNYHIPIQQTATKTALILLRYIPVLQYQYRPQRKKSTAAQKSIF